MNCICRRDSASEIKIDRSRNAQCR